MELGKTKGNNEITTKATEAFIKDYDTLDEFLRVWYDELCEKKRLCIAISRKAPRLIEWCQRKWGKSADGPNVVSEIAIPFLQLDKHEECVVVDEAIYHGTTFSKICEMVQSPYPSLKVTALPLVVTQKALFAYPTLKDKLNKSYSIICEDDINFFIDTIVMRFQDCFKPYDMEFPIMYVPIDKEFDGDIVKQITDNLGHEEQEILGLPFLPSGYAIDNYSREHKEVRYTYSYVFEYRFDELLNEMQKPNFCKLRFRYDSDKRVLTMAIMAPYIINDTDIIEDSPLFGGDMLSLWKKIYNAAFTASTNENEYLYQRRKSLVVMANYLLSYNAYQLVRPSLEKVLSEYTCQVPNIELVDLTYLLGDYLAQIVLSDLKLIDCYKQPLPVLLAATRSTSYIPMLYTDSYNSSIGYDNLKAGEGISAKVSNLFSAMRWEVDMQSRNEPQPRYYNRLRYGESYDSLISRFADGDLSEGEMRTAIHRSLDSRIDRGSVVPNYIQLDNLSTYWTRLFRSGENEDLLKDQFLRVVCRVFSEYESQTNNQKMPRAVFNLLFSLIINNDDSYSPLFCLKTDKVLNACNENTYLDFGGAKKSVIDHAIAYGVFENETGDYLKLNSYTRTLRYMNGVPLSSQEDERIVRAVRKIKNLDEKHNYTFNDYSNLALIMHYDLIVLRKKIEIYGKESIEGIKAFSLTTLRLRLSSLFELLFKIPQSVDIKALDLSDEWLQALSANNNKVRDDNQELEKLIALLMRMIYIYHVYILSRGGTANPLFDQPVLRDGFITNFTTEEIEIIKTFQESNSENNTNELLQLLVCAQ